MLNAPNELHGGTAMRACRGIGLVSVERVESKRVDDFASMSDEESGDLSIRQFRGSKAAAYRMAWELRLHSADGQPRHKHFHLPHGLPFGGVLVAAFAFHLYLTGG